MLTLLIFLLVVGLNVVLWRILGELFLTLLAGIFLIDAFVMVIVLMCCLIF